MAKKSSSSKAPSMRSWLWEGIYRVLYEKAYSNLYVKNHLNQLPENQRALATQIFYGTLQNHRYCRHVWMQYAKGKVNNRIAALLDLSTYQLLFLDGVPAYAIIHEAVSLAKRKSPRLGGFVNAILRKVSQFKPEEISQDLKQVALRTSLPDWLVELWAEQYGAQKAIEFAKASLAAHPAYIRFNPLKSGKSGMAPFSRDLDLDFEKGEYSYQDPGSYEIACYMQPEKGETILDICAAPGQKSFAMAEMMENEGSVDSLDLHEHRVKLIEQDAARLGLSIVHPRVQDSTKLDEFGEYDRILCDVPCSGMGILARKPDLRLNLSRQELESLIPLQYELLNEASKHVKDGGTIVYSTCTINKDENENQVGRFLKEHPEFVLDEQKLIELNDKSDGFYMARLKKA